ncbi:hypothetical protein K1719_030419 [Acacia pycnantha]|nr:hypothetical protein K1719_030419 [Acacia pycnantha]
MIENNLFSNKNRQSYSLREANTVFKGSYYTVVVDCGSTGTRVNVHEWTVDSVSTTDLPILLHSYPDNTTRSSLWKSSCQYHCMQTEPGLDKFVNNSSGVKESLEPLIIWAEKLVPRERHKDTPIFVLATAGLRRLTSSDAEQVLEDVEAVVKDHSFMYRKSWIRVLSGREEAYYGWVALNYKIGSFVDYPKSPTLGLLDLGGSSLQIVMEVVDTNDDIDTMRSKLNSIEHQIIAYSLPAFGLNEAFDRTIYMLTNNHSREKTGDSFEIRHPCLRSNFLQNYTCYSCTGYEKNHSKLQKDELSYLRLVGEPDWGRCKDLAIAAALNLSDLSAPHPTLGSGIYNLTAVAHPTRRFHALSGFFLVHSKLNLNPRANITKVWESGKHLCSALWAGLSSISDNPNYAGQFCFRVAYMASLIEYTLHLDEVEMVFGPGDVSWTFGAALVEGKFFLRNNTPSKVQTIISTLKKFAVMSSPTFLFVILLLLLLIVYCCQIKLPMPSRKTSAPGISLPSYIQMRQRSKF